MTVATAMAENLGRRAPTSLLNFILATFPAYKPSWFHRELAASLDQFLADVAARLSPRLIIMAPPQHGKSEIVSRRFPAYALGRYPDLKIIASSYNAELAESFSSDVQRVVDSEEYHAIFPETRIVGRYAGAGKALRQAGLFDIVGRRGSYRACGVGGGITGRGADIFIVDDPLKGAAEAHSQPTRDANWNWFRFDGLTRLSEGGGVIIVMTRWHLDDLAGRLLHMLGEDGGKCRVLRFPAIAEQDEKHRRAGDPLCPELFSLSTLEEQRRILGSQAFDALFQQNPSAPEGAILKRAWINFYNLLPDDMDEFIQTWDLSYKGGTDSDYVAGQVWGRKGAYYYLVDRVHGQFDFSRTQSEIVLLSTKWPQATAKLVEDNANGPAILSALRERIEGLIPVSPQGSKESRVHAVSPLFEARNVFVPDPASMPWVDEVIDEWISFPHARHDDDVDAMTQALLRLRFDERTPFLFGPRDSTTPQGVELTPREAREERLRRAQTKVTDGEPLRAEDWDALVFTELLKKIDCL